MESDKPRPRRRRWLRIFGAVVAFGVLALGISIWYLLTNLTELAQWAVHRAIPAAVVEIGNVHFDGVSSLVVEKFVLRDRASNDEVLRLDRGDVVFSFDAIWRNQLSEIRLVNPIIRVNPGIGNLFPVSDKKGAAGKPWSFLRIVCDYGEIRYSGNTEHSPAVNLKFAMDWRDFGDPAAAAKPLELTIWDVQATVAGTAEPFLVLDVVRLTASPDSISKRSTVDSVFISSGLLTVGPALEKIFSGPPDADSKVALPALKIGKLDIANVAVRLDDNRPEIADITFRLNTTFQDIPIANMADAVGDLPQSVEVNDLEIMSPHDPFAKVLTLRSVIVRFHLGGLLRRELDAVEIDRPTVYVGEDLFWYMEDMSKRFGTSDTKPSGGWTIRKLNVQAGSLVIASSGRANYGLPLNFRATASDVELDNLASLQIETVFEIPGANYEFESYQLALSTRDGELRFAYPPEKGEQNLVGKIFINRIVWRQYEASESWVSATFDAKGINGAFGGEAYGGYVGGGFSFFFDAASPWIGWLSGEKVSLRKLTDIISPQNFRMTGPIDFRLQMDAFGKNFERIKGDFKVRGGGKMKISKLDDLLARVPDTWSALKSSSTRIAVETLRDFDYTSARGNLWFVREQGVVELRLQGPLGSRNFDLVLHADESKEGRWKSIR